MAARIRARAMRRAGELLKQIEPGKTGPKQLTDAADTQLSRTEVAKRAGMSERQQVTAVRVANIPERDFAAQVESANPPTLTELARQGTQKREPPTNPETWLKGRDPMTFNAILHMLAASEAPAEATGGHWLLPAGLVAATLRITLLPLSPLRRGASWMRRSVRAGRRAGASIADEGHLRHEGQ